MSHQESNSFISNSNDLNLSCPECESKRITTENIKHRFPYGKDADAVELSACIPVRRCGECGDEFLDSEADDLMHEAVCHHLHVMTPSEVQAIRKQCVGLSRAEFTRITRLGEATLARWERGALIQNAAYDQFLYLLTFAENMIRLRKRVDNAGLAEVPKDIAATTQKFPSLNVTPALTTEAGLFNLNTVGI